jgi:hypothetical protein
MLLGEITPEAASLYAYITNFSMLSPERVATLVLCGGRERHRIEDTFNTQKNNGIGLEHVFCAKATASKNYYWILTCRAVSNDSMTGRDGPPSKGWLVPSGRGCALVACHRTCRPWARSASVPPEPAARKTPNPIPLTV